MPSQQQYQAVIDRIKQVGGQNDRLSTKGMTLAPNTPGEESVVAEFKAVRPTAIREGVAYDANLAAYESFAANGTAGDSETFPLSHDLIDADSVADDIVVYEGETDVTSSISVDYAANEFTYSSPNTNTTLHAYYVSDEQARVEIVKKAPKNMDLTLDERDAGLINLRDQGRDPLDFDFSLPLAGWLPTNWRVQVVVDAPYQVEWENGANGEATPRNAVLSFPIFVANGEIEGLQSVVKDEISEV